MKKISIILSCLIFLGCENKTRTVSTLIGTGGGGYAAI